MTDRPSEPKRTRVALRITGGPGPSYLAAAADAVARVDGADVVLVVLVEPKAERRPSRGRIVAAFDAVYERLERLTLPGGPSALSRTRLGLPAGVPTVPDADQTRRAEAMRSSEADVLVDLSLSDDATLFPPPAGRWRLRYSDQVGGRRLSRLSRPMRSTGLVESLLTIDLPSGSNVESEVGVSAVQRIGFSRSRDAVYWRSSVLPARRLARLASGTTVPTDSVDRAAAPGSGHAPPLRPAPATPPFAGLAFGLLGKVVERALFRSSWVVLVRQRDPDQATPHDLTGFRPIQAPRGRFFADPFAVATTDGPRLYVEDCPDGAHQGRISVLGPDAQDGWTLERVVLDDIEHRAYPHAIRVDAGLLVTPDGGRSGGVDFFIDSGSGPLQRVGRCLEGTRASDPTLLWHDGRYWLFVTVTDHGMSPWDELRLFWAESITGLWHPHPDNPIVADVRRARPAGRIMWTTEGFVRPGQDCSVEYGRRIVLSAITRLSTTAYEEHPIASIEPTGIAGISRTHTYSADGATEALDGYRRVVRRPWGDRGSPRTRAVEEP